MTNEVRHPCPAARLGAGTGRGAAPTAGRAPRRPGAARSRGGDRARLGQPAIRGAATRPPCSPACAHVIPAGLVMRPHGCSGNAAAAGSLGGHRGAGCCGIWGGSLCMGLARCAAPRSACSGKAQYYCPLQLPIMAPPTHIRAPPRALLALAAICCWVSGAAAGGNPDFDYFYLVRQWPATFCNDHSCTHSPPKRCGAGRRFTLRTRGDGTGGVQGWASGG